MREIGLEQFLNRPWRILRLEVAVDLLPELGIETETSTGEQVIAFGGFVGITDGNLGGDQAYVEADAVFGGVEIVVPEDWQVIPRGAGVFGGSFTGDWSGVTTAVPEPGSLALFGAGLSVIGWARRRTRRTRG